MNNKGFACSHCGKFIPFKAPGTKNRNHCPRCLYSVHLDNLPGDRQSSCKGLMAPIGKFNKPDGEEMLVHKCEKCGFTRKNRVAGDDSYESMDALPLINPADLGI